MKCCLCYFLFRAGVYIPREQRAILDSFNKCKDSFVFLLERLVSSKEKFSIVFCTSLGNPKSNHNSHCVTMAVTTDLNAISTASTVACKEVLNASLPPQ